MLDLTVEIFKQATTWIPTPKLNTALETIKYEQGVASKGGKCKIYYGTQVAVNPITILTFVNNPKLFDDNFQRFIIGRLGGMLSISEVPIRLVARSHREQKKD
jgi:GTP-binding protein